MPCRASPMSTRTFHWAEADYLIEPLVTALLLQAAEIDADDVRSTWGAAPATARRSSPALPAPWWLSRVTPNSRPARRTPRGTRPEHGERRRRATRRRLACTDALRRHRVRRRSLDDSAGDHRTVGGRRTHGRRHRRREGDRMWHSFSASGRNRVATSPVRCIYSDAAGLRPATHVPLLVYPSQLRYYPAPRNITQHEEGPS